MQTRETKTWLVVSFQEKDQAKLYGARWDPNERRWYAPPNTDLLPLRKWCPNDIFEESEESEESEEQQGISLSELLIRTKMAVEKITKPALWVKAEIIDLNRNKWGTSFELGETHNGEIIAKSRGRLWSNHQKKVDRKFQSAGIEIQKGNEALLLVHATFHPLYGFQLEVVDIDPDFILGKLEKKRKEILNQLSKEGLIDKNKTLPRPMDFQHVVVISPQKSAGQGDFQREAKDLERRGLCRFTYLSATFQGPQAASSLCDALERTIKIVESKPTDAIVLIRGGGATTDLKWLDDEALARMICLSPLPILTGIGHEKNRSVLDEVSHQCFDTPSKVSLHIRECILEQGRQTIEAIRIIRTTAKQMVDVASVHTKEKHQQIESRSTLLTRTYLEKTQKEVGQIRQAGISLLQLCRQRKQSEWKSTNDAIDLIHRSRSHIEQLREQLINDSQQLPLKAKLELKSQSTKTAMLAKMEYHKAFTLVKSTDFLREVESILKNTRVHTKNLMSVVLSRHPRSILEHGFSIARSPTGNVVTTQKTALQCDSLHLEFQDGVVHVHHPKPITKGESNE